MVAWRSEAGDIQEKVGIQEKGSLLRETQRMEAVGCGHVASPLENQVQKLLSGWNDIPNDTSG